MTVTSDYGEQYFIVLLGSELNTMGIAINKQYKTKRFKLVYI